MKRTSATPTGTESRAEQSPGSAGSTSSLTRRALFPTLGFAAGASAGWFVDKHEPDPSHHLLRPPGAGSEPDFLAACIRCGQCVEACPYDTLQLAKAGASLSMGTPFVDARSVPCKLCQGYDELLCIESCPTAALQPVEEWRAIRMGVAIVDRDLCLAWNGISCRACWHACPFPNEAIELDDHMRPEVVAEVCIGCGLCDHACLTETSSIPIRPSAAWRAGDPAFVGEGTS